MCSLKRRQRGWETGRDEGARGEGRGEPHPCGVLSRDLAGGQGPATSLPTAWGKLRRQVPSHGRQELFWEVPANSLCLCNLLSWKVCPEWGAGGSSFT